MLKKKKSLFLLKCCLQFPPLLPLVLPLNVEYVTPNQLNWTYFLSLISPHLKLCLWLTCLMPSMHTVLCKILHAPKQLTFVLCVEASLDKANGIQMKYEPECGKNSWFAYNRLRAHWRNFSCLPPQTDAPLFLINTAVHTGSVVAKVTAILILEIRSL